MNKHNKSGLTNKDSCPDWVKFDEQKWQNSAEVVDKEWKEWMDSYSWKGLGYSAKEVTINCPDATYREQPDKGLVYFSVELASSDEAHYFKCPFTLVFVSR